MKDCSEQGADLVRIFWKSRSDFLLEQTASEKSIQPSISRRRSDNGRLSRPARSAGQGRASGERSERRLDAPKRWHTLSVGAVARHDRTRHRPGFRRRCNTAKTTSESSSVHRVGEGLQQCSADLAVENGELLRRFANAREYLLDVRQKAWSRIVVPAGGLLEISLRKRPHDESPDDSD